MIVENLSSKVSWQDLKDIMRRTGEVSYANAHNKRQREGVVEFGSKRDLERALDKYQGYELHGRKLKVWAKGREGRSRSRSRSRSRKRDRSKSKDRSRDRKRSKSDRSRSKERRDRSRSKGRRDRSRSKDRERSRSEDDRDRSRSKSQ